MKPMNACLEVGGDHFQQPIKDICFRLFSSKRYLIKLQNCNASLTVLENSCVKRQTLRVYCILYEKWIISIQDYMHKVMVVYIQVEHCM